MMRRKNKINTWTEQVESFLLRHYELGFMESDVDRHIKIKIKRSGSWLKRNLF